MYSVRFQSVSTPTPSPIVPAKPAKKERNPLFWDAVIGFSLMGVATAAAVGYSIYESRHKPPSTVNISPETTGQTTISIPLDPVEEKTK